MEEPLLEMGTGLGEELPDEDEDGGGVGGATIWGVTLAVIVLLNVVAGCATLVVRYAVGDESAVLIGCDAPTLFKLLLMVTLGGYAVAVFVRLLLLATHAMIVALTRCLSRGPSRPSSSSSSSDDADGGESAEGSLGHGAMEGMLGHLPALLLSVLSLGPALFFLLWAVLQRVLRPRIAPTMQDSAAGNWDTGSSLCIAIAALAGVKTTLQQVFGRAVSRGGSASRGLSIVVRGELVISELRRLARERRQAGGQSVSSTAATIRIGGSGGRASPSILAKQGFSAATHMLRRAVTFTAQHLHPGAAGSADAVPRDAAPEVALAIMNSLGTGGIGEQRQQRQQQQQQQQNQGTPCLTDRSLEELCGRLAAKRVPRETVLAILDSDGDGAVTTQDLTTALESLADARATLFTGQRNRSALAHFASFAVDFVFWTVAVIAGVAVFGADPSHLFVPFATVLAASSFVFGEFLSGLFLSCVMIFWVQPFGVGEVISVSGFDGNYLVRNITIPATHCASTSGETVVFPNAVLAKARISNLSRCGGRIRIELEFSIDGRVVTLDRIKMFETRLGVWLASQPGQWTKDVQFDMAGIVDRRQGADVVRLVVAAFHVGAWDKKKRWKDARVELRVACAAIIRELGMQGEEMPEYVVHSKKD